MERYTDYVKIGEGSFGSVHRALDSHTGEQVAIKVFHNAGQEVSRSAVREARFLAESCHCNITALREAYQSGSGRVYLVLEYAHHVLSHQLKSHKKGLPTVAVRSIIFQLLQALHYLHSKGVMHRDCKPANILITNDGMVKLCDFGFARYVAGGAPPETADDPLTSYVITRWYRPPEVLSGQPYSCAVDIWAVGCILAEMLTGHPLFPGSSSIDQLYIEHIGLGGLTASQQAFMNGHKDIKQTQADFNTRMAVIGSKDTVFDRLAPYMTRSMMQFFKACLTPDPNKRATAKDLLEMSFIREGAWDVPAPGQSIPETAANAETGVTEKQVIEHVQTANIETAVPDVHTPSLSGITVKPSRSQKMGPTVKQRTAKEVAMMMSDDEDGDQGVYEHLNQLPPGEPLSDSDTELSERTSSGVASPQRTSSPKPVSKQNKAGVTSQLSAASLNKTHASMTRAGTAKAHLHSSFAAKPGRKSLTGNTATQSSTHKQGAASDRVTDSSHRVQMHVPDAQGEQMSSHHGSAFAMAAKRNASAPGVSAFEEVDRSSSERDTGSRKERFSAGRVEDPVFDAKPPTGRKVQLREPASCQSGTAGQVTDGKVARAFNSSHAPSDDGGLRGSNSGVGRLLRDKVSVPHSSSATALAPRASMRQAKQLPVRGHQQGSKAGVSFAELPPSSTEQHASQSDFIPAKPTAVQMTAAAITQASAALVTMSTSFVDTGPKSAGHTLHSGHKPKCPPPPRAPQQPDAPPATGQGQKPAAVNLAGKLGNSGFHLSGRLNKVIPSAVGGLVGVGQPQNNDGATNSNRPHSALAKSRASQSGALTSRLSISVTASADVASDSESPSAQALSKSQRMLSPMGLRHTLSSKSAYGVSNNAAHTQDHTAHEETLQN